MSQPLIVIQARNGGTRLPGKVNMLIGDRRMLDIVIARVRRTGLKWMLCRAEDYREVPEEDVLSRFQTALAAIDPQGDAYDPLIRVTADCPLWEPQVAEWALAAFRERSHADLCGTGPAWDGLDVEVFSRRALDWAAGRAQSADRQHVTSYIKRWGSCYEIPAPERSLRLSVDTREGLEVIRAIFRACDLCAGDVPRHSNSGSGIGGPDRHLCLDLHHLDRGDLAECTAYDILKTRIGGEVYRSL